MPSADFEKLGQFYLGKVFDLASRKRTDTLAMYDSKDLVTHAVCVGMTGSGKTGLCLGLIEEAAIDGIPAIVIDPKGDLSNLLLTFPNLKPEDFRPWINEEDAAKKGVSPDEFAAQQAALWAKGLGEWGQDGARIQRMKDAAEFAIYTPGSSAGLGVSVLKSFAAPPDEIMEDGELLRERISTTASSLLSMAGITSDANQGREHIFLSAVIGNAWGAKQDLDIPGIIQRVQQPPFTKLGVMELESVYPSKDRFALAMALNNLVASPNFGAWMEGEPLDIGAMLHTPQGKPRVAVFSIAHLGDAERMFFVSLLMNQILGWVRTQSGTGSLRALVYMDEIAGYFPPTAMPPSKQPMLTLMKQARAFGVGMVLATQNPVDLDYKGLSNAGTWFIGRLQTERDKQRVLDGLEGAMSTASAKFDRAAIDRALSALGPRVFLLNNVHEDGPEIIETRWCLSYLRGPLTRGQIKSLMSSRKGAGMGSMRPDRQGGGSSAPASASPAFAGASASSAASTRPVLPSEIPQYFIPARAIPAGSTLVYQPMLMGTARVYYTDPKVGIDQDEPQALLVGLKSGPGSVDWDAAEQVDLSESDLESEPAGGGAFAPLPPDAAKAKSYEMWKKAFADALFKIGKLELLKHPALKAISKQGESEKDFRLRLAQLQRESRDAAAERLRTKYGPKLAAIQDRIRKAQQRVDVEKAQATESKIGTAMSIGAAILGAFLGRKTISATNISKASTAVRSVGRATRESGDVGRAEENVGSLQQQYNDLDTQFRAEVDELAAMGDPMTDQLERVVLKPKKTNINVRTLVLAWAPHAVDAGGSATPAW
ncbi:MAG: ATP-binding protein [Phycisphaerales bacterium]